MAKGQISVSAKGLMKDVLVEAREVFDDTESDAEAIRRVSIDWYRNRQINSKRGSLSRIEKSDAQILAMVTQFDARLRAIEQNIVDLFVMLRSKGE